MALSAVWNHLRTSFWFVPALMVVATAVAALLLLRTDWTVPIWDGRDDARSLLSTLAGSLITVTSVVFSLTIVTLHLASGQFGPRIMRSFIRDRAYQFALGTFLGTFVFCLFALAGRPAANSITVMVAIGMTGLSVAVLIYFIHHIATTVQADRIIPRLTREALATIDRAYPETMEAPPKVKGKVRHAPRAGYINSIDAEKVETGHVMLPVGSFVLEGDEVLRGGRIEGVHIGDTRTEDQDVAFGIQQLSGMAARALSPGINDPFTAIACIDHLMIVYAVLAQRPHGPIGLDGSRIERPTLEDLLENGLGVIIPYAEIPAVKRTLREGIHRLIACAPMHEATWKAWLKKVG